MAIQVEPSYAAIVNRLLELGHGEFVYFFHAPAVGMVKIGRSDKPHKRLGGARGASPVPLEPLGVVYGPPQLEGRLHRKFAHLRSHGEWFRADDRLMAFIRRWSHPWEALDRVVLPHPRRPVTPEEIWAVSRELAARRTRNPLGMTAPKLGASAPVQPLFGTVVV